MSKKEYSSISIVVYNEANFHLIEEITNEVAEIVDYLDWLLAVSIINLSAKLVNKSAEKLLMSRYEVGNLINYGVEHVVLFYLQRDIAYWDNADKMVKFRSELRSKQKVVPLSQFYNLAMNPNLLLHQLNNFAG